MEIKILQNSVSEELTKDINTHLNEGWKLLNPLVVVPIEKSEFLVKYVQMMQK